MADDNVDTELYDLLLEFVHVSRKLQEGSADREELLMECMDLATQLRQRGFMLSEQQLRGLDRRLLLH